MSTRIGSTETRWQRGIRADEGALVCRPKTARADAGAQAGEVYRALVDSLVDHQASLANLASEKLFLRDRGELPEILDARCRVLRELGVVEAPPVPTLIQQPPVDRDIALELAASVSVDRVPQTRTGRASGEDLRANLHCACRVCSGSGGRLQHLGREAILNSTIFCGRGENALAQARDMFCNARRFLENVGMDFHNVVRTWIYLEDIDRDYAALNQARREFFEACGLEQRPASTGVQGAPCGEDHVCGLSLQAISPRPADLEIMTTPYLNEAWSYGADFSRGLRVVRANGVVLHLSGTASIDEAGNSLHLGDLEAQAERMLDNIESLLGEQGADFSSLLSGVIYVKRAADAGQLRAVLQRRGFEGFPCVFVEAPLCRPELLCEAEAVAG